MIKGIFYTAAFCGLSAGGAFGLAYVHDIMDRTPASVVSVPMDVPTPAALNIDTIPSNDTAPVARIEQASLPVAPALEDTIAEPKAPEAVATRATPVKRTPVARATPKKSNNVVASISTRSEQDTATQQTNARASVTPEADNSFGDAASNVTLEDKVLMGIPAAREGFSPVTRTRSQQLQPRNRIASTWTTGVFR